MYKLPKRDISMQQMEEQFTTRRECKLKDHTVEGLKTSVDNVEADIGAIKESLASIATWMEEHNKVHNKVPSGWTKTQTYAVVIAVIISSMSFISTAILGVISVLNMTGKP